MMYAYSTYGLLVVVVILLYLLFWKPPTPQPVKGRDITGDDQSPLKKWDCSSANRQIVLSDVPAGIAPYLYPFNEDELRKQPLEGVDVLISIVADIRLLDQNSNEVQELKDPVKLWMSYNADDILALQKNGYAVDNLTPVKIVPGQTGWRKFSKEGAVDYNNINCGELGGVYITINSWGDPPIGWGVPR